jgi:hypothetical protein
MSILDGPKKVGEPTKSYLDYLDKEMTIMGILSTFCVAAASLIIDRLSSAVATNIGTPFFARVATLHPVQIYLGAALLMLAGLFFYLQRSRLALFYGGICMSVAMPDLAGWTVEDWLTEAYSYAAWIRYRVAFIILTAAGIVFAFGIVETIYPNPSYLWKAELILLLPIMLGMSFHNLLCFVYRYADSPWSEFSITTFKEDWRHREEVPERETEE